MTDSGITVDSIDLTSFNQQSYEMKAEKEATINIEGNMYTRDSDPETRFAPRTTKMDGNKHKNIEG